MKKATVSRIVLNREIYHRPTVIGRYTYDVGRYGDGIYRCLTVNAEKSWIDRSGKMFGGWQKIWEF